MTDLQVDWVKAEKHGKANKPNLKSEITNDRCECCDMPLP